MAEITREELLARYVAGEREFSGLDLSNINPTVSDFRECFSDSYGLNSCVLAAFIYSTATGDTSLSSQIIAVIVGGFGGLGIGELFKNKEEE